LNPDNTNIEFKLLGFAGEMLAFKDEVKNIPKEST
jgi:hypothetical protein